MEDHAASTCRILPGDYHNFFYCILKYWSEECSGEGKVYISEASSCKMSMKSESHKYSQEMKYATCTVRSQVSRFVQIFHNFAGFFFFMYSGPDSLFSLVSSSSFEHQDWPTCSTLATCGLPVSLMRTAAVSFRSPIYLLTLSLLQKNETNIVGKTT